MRRVMSLLLLFCPCSAFALDITQYELLRENVVTKDASSEWDYVLIFKDTPFRVALGPRWANDSQIEGDDNNGLNEETLQISWLAKDELFWITWRTFPVANGAYSAQACIVMRHKGGKLSELLREGYLARVKLGAGEFWHKDITFEWIPNERRLIKRIAASDRIWSEDRIPAAEPPSPGGYIREVSFDETVTYRPEEDRLQFVSSNISLELGERKVPANEIAELFVLYLAPRWGTQLGEGSCTPKERENMLRDLRLKEGDLCTGKTEGPSWTRGVFKP
ncbi:MAG: hypothetical protein WC655_27725, partial [Candidatus Hydrogenedentales bacterium]